MADVELVIKIPEEMYKWVNDVNKFFDDYGTSDFIDLVKSGTPLPKGHGKIIDVKEADLVNRFYAYETFEDAYNLVDSLPSIIDADKAESEEAETNLTFCG